MKAVMASEKRVDIEAFLSEIDLDLLKYSFDFITSGFTSNRSMKYEV